MIVETNNFNNEDITNNFFLDFPIEDCILFDIETTGLSSTKHMIYLIGFIYYKDKTWHSENLLATNLDDESLIFDDVVSVEHKPNNPPTV